MTNLIDCFQQLPHCITNPRTTWVHLFGFTRNHLHPIWCLQPGACIRRRSVCSPSGDLALVLQNFRNLEAFCKCRRYHSFFTLHNRKFAFSLDVRQSNFLFVKMGSPLSEDISTPSKKKNQEINPLMVFYILVGLVSTWRGFDIHLSIQPNKAVG